MKSNPLNKETSFDVNEIREQWITLDNRQVFFRIAGNGQENLLLLHGGGSDHSGFTWRYTIPALAQHYTVIALDLPGYGNSEGPDWRTATPESPVQYAENFISKFLDEMGIKETHLMGFSMGGGIALGYALKNPARVKRLILVDSAGFTSRVPGGFAAVLAAKTPLFYEISRLVMLRNRFLVKLGLRRMVHFPVHITPELVDDIWGSMKKMNMHPAWKVYTQREIDWDGLQSNYAEKLSRLYNPTLVIHGEFDKMFDVKTVQSAAKNIPNGIFQCFSNCGHLTPIEYPAKFNRLVRDFLEGAISTSLIPQAETALIEERI